MNDSGVKKPWLRILLIVLAVIFASIILATMAMSIYGLVLLTKTTTTITATASTTTSESFLSTASKKCVRDPPSWERSRVHRKRNSWRRQNSISKKWHLFVFSRKTQCFLRNRFYRHRLKTLLTVDIFSLPSKSPVHLNIWRRLSSYTIEDHSEMNH